MESRGFFMDSLGIEERLSLNKDVTRQEWLLAGPGQHSLTREFAVVPVLRSQLSIALHCLSLLILVWQQHHDGARLEYFLPVLLNHVIPFFKIILLS